MQALNGTSEQAHCSKMSREDLISCAGVASAGKGRTLGPGRPAKAYGEGPTLG